MRPITFYAQIIQIAIIPVLAYKLVVEGLFLYKISPLTVILFLLNMIVMYLHNPVWHELLSKWRNSNKDKED
ncbi:hypothetical protein P4493_06180 [Bacillus thuringiensis]|jgi:hypothetical protein|uniref:Membrane protein n=3 Tax=Bacillus thuringiensis TaxID=1428 RepID=A0A0B5N947_BACTU|nr:MULTISPECIES: hypothetical protein [Bacillus]EAO56534.1 hypothetical protein RBTH_05469 [Bacillus thuringiensis serovar israelensis ATCC 35646]MEC2533152.1 hypothetical protein [Bacillus cereus]MED1153868.1 hypothetical protein [Bacillus paranthracis]OUB09281.1 hypothetical protein BK708_32650 [Bacillus thuringiensis serovar yunnanensis]AFQ30177.1 hypothetical protein BTF1_30382 [Bacillus thuringiensis HD-789]